MKNNKKFNRTFKVSLVAVALGLVNQAWAEDVQCNNNSISISEKDNGTLINCQINYEALSYQGSVTALSILNSQNFNISDSNVNISYNAEHEEFTSEITGIYIDNSIVNLNNTNVNTSSKNIREVSSKINNSNVKINGGTFTAHSSSEYVSEVFNLQDSTININNAILLPIGDGTSAIEFNKNSTAILNNVTITATDDASIFQYSADEDNPNSSITINNSQITADGEGTLLDSNWDIAKNRKGYFSLNLNNTTVDTPILTSLGDTSPESNNTDNGVSLTEHLNINVIDSSIKGTFIDNTNGNTQNQLNVKLTNSSWGATPYTDAYDNKEYQSVVTNLDLNNSVVNLERVNNFQTLTILGNLTGSGTFNLNTNIAQNQGDKILVKGTAEGNHKINVTNQGENVANHKLTLVETNGGNAKFSLTNAGGHVDLGAYQYFLVPEGNNWVLANSQNAVKPITPTTPTQPNKPTVTPTDPAVPTVNPTPSDSALPNSPLLSKKANAQVSLRQAQLLLVENELNGIHERLGEVKNGEKGNVWVRNVNSREKLTALSTGESKTSGFKQNVHSLQLGADTALNDNFRLGAFVGRSQANVDFNGNYGDGKVRSHSVGLYATYLADNGIYLDNIVKYSRVKAESDHTEKRHYHAYTLSSELGKQFKLAGDLTITPQAQLAWTHLQGKENEDSLSSVSSRLGVRVAKGFALANGWNLQPYAEINAITSRNRHSKVHYAKAALDVESSRGRFESAIGLNAGVANHRIGLEVSRADGSRYDKPYQIQAVYRYQW